MYFTRHGILMLKHNYSMGLIKEISMKVIRSINGGFLLITDIVRCPFDSMRTGGSPIMLWRDDVMMAMIQAEYETDFLIAAKELGVPEQKVK